jgi:[acyl-carrier-protein] S-malonyltransferase
MLLLAAPGQGAQSPGFLRPWLEIPGIPEQLAAWSELTGCDLIRYGTTASAEEITDTAIAQPLLLAAAVAAAGALGGGLEQTRRQAGAAAGHSVGELAAGTIAGVITPEQAMGLVSVRGPAMARAAAAGPTGMTAVIGGDEAEVLAAIEACGLTPANINGAGQIVAAGTRDQLAAFAASPPPGARLRPLSVAGAFHTQHMAPAVAALRAAADGLPVRDPEIVLLSNRDGAAVRSGQDWLERIVTQVSAPVRWNMCMQSMAGLGVTAFIELPPAGALTGLAKRALRGVELAAVKTPDDLDAARALLTRHGAPDPHEDAQLPDWRLLVAPAGGTFRHPVNGEAVPAGQAVSPGTALGHVQMRSGQHEVSPQFPARVIEWLVEDGDPVSPGQPLVRLLPEHAE